ncbi:bifunctional hydroxymethylpyrimidine kinase/phosphomethylpyrimidine kinase [Candidatus Sororendozoicomonas aggregata]|uniref:bifunctional hydroxymethylpyrimidine kinase/phosphomethylpyrimidine kinase n=1 Tax=Candidatus Sororendozoicomonas aggregata TaxID=3073239 RepID=UPI002ED3B13B
MTSIALTIAGSDSSGGAGIQADLKAFSALGAYGCSVITALTAQNTLGVQAIADVEPDFITQQLQSVFSDLSINAVKVGMLSRAAIITPVVDAIDHFQPDSLVVDPVMVATSGDVLLQQEAISCLKETLLPKATLITPNLAEAAVLTGREKPTSVQDMEAMIDPLLALGAKALLLKGGHLCGNNAIDLFHDGKQLHRLESPRIKTTNTHGTGCTLSSAITALLARGYSLDDAVQSGKNYITQAITHASALTIGQGHGPVHHFYKNW